MTGSEERGLQYDALRDKLDSFVYSDEVKRTQKSNKMFLVISLLLDAFMMLSAVQGVVLGLGITAIIRAVLILTAIVLGIASYLRDKRSPKVRYIIGFSFSAAYFIYCVLSTSFYPVLFMAPVVAAGMLFSDRKWSVIFSVTGEVTTVVSLAAGVISGAMAPDQIASETGLIVIAAIYFSTSMLATKSLNKFNGDTFGRIEANAGMNKLMLEDIMDNARDLFSKSNELKDIINKLITSNEVVINSSKEVSTGIQGVAENIQEQTVMTNNIQGDIIGMSNQVTEAAGVSDNAFAVVKDNIDTVKRLKEHSIEIAEGNQKVADAMQLLQEKVVDVQNITSLIVSISSQTNLLALNASIESARAGEAGRGFAVVADQIRQLADQTKGATEQISSILNELSENAALAVDNVQMSVKATDLQVEYIENVYEGFNNINSGIQTLSENMKSVSKTMSGVQQSNTVIVDNISQLSATSEEITASSEETNSVTMENEELFNVLQNKFKELERCIKEFEKYNLN